MSRAQRCAVVMSIQTLIGGIAVNKDRILRIDGIPVVFFSVDNGKEIFVFFRFLGNIQLEGKPPVSVDGQ